MSKQKPEFYAFPKSCTKKRRPTNAHTFMWNRYFWALQHNLRQTTKRCCLYHHTLTKYKKIYVQAFGCCIFAFLFFFIYFSLFCFFFFAFLWFSSRYFFPFSFNTKPPFSLLTRHLLPTPKICVNTQLVCINNNNNSSNDLFTKITYKIVETLCTFNT